MDNHESVEVELTAELAQFIHRRVRDGGFASDADVVRDVLQHAVQHAAVLAETRHKIDAGMASLQAGGGIDGGDFMAAVDAELAELERNGR